MAVVIEFEFEEDLLRAIDLLAEAEHGYERIPRDLFLVSNLTARLLKDEGVNFRVIGGPEEEKWYVTHP